MTTTAQRKQVIEHLHQGNLLMAKQLFSEIQLKAPIDQINLYLLEAKISFYEGSYHKALPLLEACKVIDPTNLEALSDLALCYYHLGLPTACEKTLDEAVLRLQSRMSLLPTEDCLNHGILFAKLFEERALLGKALDLLISLEKLSLSEKQAQILRIQQLRLFIEKQDRRSASLIYSQVVQGLHHSLSFEIEREHILLLADSFLFGFEQSAERFSYLMSQNLCPVDRNFIVSEMLELAILSARFDFLAKHSPDLKNENEYEQLQAQLVMAFLNEQFPQFHITRLEKTLSRMSLLRILRQALFLFPKDSRYAQWALRFRFHCHQIPDKELRQKFLNLFPAEELKVLIKKDLKLIYSQGIEMHVESHLFWQMIELFSLENKEVSLDQAVQIIYREIPNEQHFDRLRMAVSRLNGQLKNKFSIDAFFKVTKSKVQLLVHIMEATK